MFLFLCLWQEFVTALCQSIKYGHLEVAQILLDRGADIEARKKVSSIFIALTIDNDYDSHPYMHGRDSLVLVSFRFVSFCFWSLVGWVNPLDGSCSF